MLLGVPKETKYKETRVALTPDVVKELIKKGYEIIIEKDAGILSYIKDEDYINAGAKIGDKASVYQADVVLKVNPPQPEEVASMKKGAVLISFMWALTNPALVEACQKAGISAFSMDAIPRISRAQKWTLYLHKPI